MAHELTHVRNYDILISSIAATIAGAISILASMARWSMLFGGSSRDDNRGGNLIGMLVMVIVAPLAALLIQSAISRSREYLADSGGADISKKPLALASALQKIHAAAHRLPLGANPATAHMFIINPLTGGDIMALFSTHPPVERRIENLKRIAHGQRI